MPPVTCPNCKKKNFTASPVCSWCNEPLGATPSAGDPLTPVSKAPPPAPIPAPWGSSPPPPVTPPPVSPPPSSSPLPVPVPPVPPPLPSHYIKLGTPSLEGTVIDTGQVQVAIGRDFAGDTLRGIFTILLLPLRPLMVLAALLFRGRQPTEYRTVHVLRVERPDHTIVQARIEQDIVGATMDAGDEVSIWGPIRGGVVYVRNAYNHSTSAEIRLRPSVDYLVSKFFLLLLLFFVIFLCLMLASN